MNNEQPRELMPDPSRNVHRKPELDELVPPEPENFVVVLAYEADDGDLPDDFVQMIEDLKALFTLRKNMRMYAVVEESAKNVLAQVERPKDEEV